MGTKSSQALRKHPLLTGALLLTVAGLFSRLIGFFYRIYLARIFGEEGMGVYQLLSPVLSLSFSLTAAAYQTAISKFTAARAAHSTPVCNATGSSTSVHNAPNDSTSSHNASARNASACNTSTHNTPVCGASDCSVSAHHAFTPLLTGLLLSLPLSLLSTLLLWKESERIAVFLLGEPRTAFPLRLIALSIPFASVHACINGYFYGIKKAAIPAASQLIEQLFRVGCTFGIASFLLKSRTPTVAVAALGLTVGEAVSTAFNIAAWRFTYKKQNNRTSTSFCFSFLQRPSSSTKVLLLPLQEKTKHLLSGSVRPMLTMVLPLTANRIVLNLLQSAESVSIPSMLRKYGYDAATALSVYGVLTGMAMPFLFFPNAFTSSVAILLLPMVSEAYENNDLSSIQKSISRAICFCLSFGSLCTLGFLLLGNFLGNFIFHSALAGHFITSLGFLCPFFYLDSILSSILQGLGKAGSLFVMNLFCLSLRLLFVFWVIPLIGIQGYLWGIFLSQLAQTVLYLFSLRYTLRHNPTKHIL